MNGSKNETFAWGLRNAVGIDFHPQTGDLYVAVQERDQLGDDLVPDYFTRIQKDEFYGWPFGRSIEIFFPLISLIFSLSVSTKYRSTPSFCQWIK